MFPLFEAARGSYECWFKMSWIWAGWNATSQQQVPNPPLAFTASTHCFSVSRLATFGANPRP
jgi:hypothetical protein